MARRGRKRNLERERLYWSLLASGVGTVEACREVGIGRRTGLRWRREQGGIRRPPARPSPAGRYLSLFERERIQTLRCQGVGVREVARRLGRSASTVSRELHRAAHLTQYDAGRAHEGAGRRALRPRVAKIAADHWLHDFIQEHLELEWSPEQISEYLRLHHPGHVVSAETIYQGLYLPHRGALRRDLAKRLRTGRTLRQPHRRANARATRFIDPGRLIDKRPAEVEARSVAGHWEGDLITGTYNMSAIGTLVERTSGYLQLVHLPADHGSPEVCAGVRATFAALAAQMRRSLTWDQGSEMSQHATVADLFEHGVFFAYPHSPWERGSNENTNGLLRQYFPKATDLSVYTAANLRAVEERLNNRPRKRLGWKSPAEVFSLHMQESGPTVATAS